MSDKLKIDRRNFIKQGVKGIATVSTVGLMSGCAGPRVNLKDEMAIIRSGGKRKSYIDGYKFDDCIECGQCMSECLFKELDEDQGIDGIIRMRKGEKVDDLLNTCTFCGKCNHRCPEDANPIALILERLRERRDKEKRVPNSLAFAINGMREKGWKNNGMRDIQSGLSKKEQKILSGWAEFKSNSDGDLLFCGCGARLFPTYIENSKVLADLPKYGRIDDCCGVIPGRAGLFDVATYVQESLLEKLSKSKFKRIVMGCGSCQEGLTLVRSHYLGREVPFEIISIYQYIDEQMQKGKATIQRQLDIDAAISDSCFGYEFGQEYLDITDRLAEAAGFKTSRLRHNNDNNACCGAGAYFSRGNIWDVSRAKKVKKNDIKKCGKENILSYCQGCFLSLNFMQPGKHHYLLEKILWALGDDITDPASNVAKKVNMKVIFDGLKIIPSAII